MDYKDIPATDNNYYTLVTFLRRQIIDNIRVKGKNAAPRIVEETLDSLMPGDILRGFESWNDQKSKLEQLFIPYFLDNIVYVNMEPERGGNRYQYALATEGRCLQRHKGSTNKFGFIRGKPLANSELYTYDELVKNWKEIFVLDDQISDDPNLRDKYAPRCSHGNVETPALVLTTQHQLRIVDNNGAYVPGTNICYSRTKSGVGHLFKMAEYLTNLRADGSGRESIDDYLAALSREPDPKKIWVKAMKCIMKAAESTRSKLNDVVRLRGYTPKEAEDLKRALESDPEVGKFVNGRTDLVFTTEALSEDMETRRIGELWFAIGENGGNKVVWQVYHEQDYTRIEGDTQTKHLEYKAKRESKILNGFTLWHWAIMKRLAPYFVDECLRSSFREVYGHYLSIDPKAFKGHDKK
ncbi:hypothetical protein HYU50_02185 [Candidatus Woesearchaeota archaeon]|nr:hypothetical protein [Candidatus Woesearchaeota archaeon]